MTDAICSQPVGYENDSTNDHLQNHVHLKKCNRLKNRMHCQGPAFAERSLMRDLLVLQRSRSLRDPSTSPHSCYSLSLIDTSVNTLQKDNTIQPRRRSLGGEEKGDIRRLFVYSPPDRSVATAKVAAAGFKNEDVIVGSFCDDRHANGVKDGRIIDGKVSSRKVHKTDRTMKNAPDLVVDHDLYSEKLGVEQKRNLLKGSYDQNMHTKTLSEQLGELHGEHEDGSQIHSHARHGWESRSEEQEGNVCDCCVREKEGRATRTAQVSVGSRDAGLHNKLSAASNSLIYGCRQRKYHKGDLHEMELEVTRLPRNGCGIPWNCSRISGSGKTFLDIAGRSRSCGIPGSRLGKSEANMPRARKDASDMPVVFYSSSSSDNSDSEALPLLFEPPGSHVNRENATWPPCEYLRELGTSYSHKLRCEDCSDLASEARSGAQHNNRACCHGRHQSLTQKYMPRTFEDLVGQNLVVQALSNAMLRRKVGFLYVFYGPRGTGKTSCARIFARALNCQSRGPTKPCGDCNSCISLDVGKGCSVQEVGVDVINFQAIMDLLDNMLASELPSKYRVLIFDDCDALPSDSLNAISKVVDLAPRQVVFVLVSTSLNQLPHMIISRCHKFLFPKLKDAEVINTLQCIASKEGLEIDQDALKLIASKSDGSLRDAEMTLDQLSLLGQKVSLPLVQELVGMVSHEKLVDLLDLALSADTVNTVKHQREIMEAGVEPLALTSQLATLITDILAGSYVFTRERLRRKFFRRPTLSKQDNEKLRQALKTFSEAEKQLRMSTDRSTWLTAALLQLAPDKQYKLPSSSADNSIQNSPTVVASQREMPKAGHNMEVQMVNNEEGTACGGDCGISSSYIPRKGHEGISPPQNSINKAKGCGQLSGIKYKEIDKIWLAVLESIHINALKQLMQLEGKLISVSFGAAPTVQLMLSSQANKSRAEKFREHILRAFESILGFPVTLIIRSELKKDFRDSDSGSVDPIKNPRSHTSGGTAKPEPESQIKKLLQDKLVKGEGSAEEIRKVGGLAWKQRLPRSKVSLARVIQQTEGQRNGWSQLKAASIVEKLEQENLVLEPKTRDLFCCKASRKLRIKTKRPRTLLKLLSCSRSLGTNSPR